MGSYEKKILIAELDNATLYHLPAEEEGGRGAELMLSVPGEEKAFLSPEEATTLALYLRSWAGMLGYDPGKEAEDMVLREVWEALDRPRAVVTGDA